eukprot:scaffold264534_cov19-Tisochrysis_lutea.AAC.1
MFAKQLAEARALQQQRRAAVDKGAPQHEGTAGGPGSQKGAVEEPSSSQGPVEEGSRAGHPNGAGMLVIMGALPQLSCFIVPGSLVSVMVACRRSLVQHLFCMRFLSWV